MTAPGRSGGSGSERPSRNRAVSRSSATMFGVRENSLDPVPWSSQARPRGQRGRRKSSTPQTSLGRGEAVLFDERLAAARALRDTTLSRREAIQNHRDLLGATGRSTRVRRSRRRRSSRPKGAPASCRSYEKRLRRPSSGVSRFPCRLQRGPERTQVAATRDRDKPDPAQTR